MKFDMRLFPRAAKKKNMRVGDVFFQVLEFDWCGLKTLMFINVVGLFRNHVCFWQFGSTRALPWEIVDFLIKNQGKFPCWPKLPETSLFQVYSIISASASIQNISVYHLIKELQFWGKKREVLDMQKKLDTWSNI